jgi:hypothetical protein
MTDDRRIGRVGLAARAAAVLCSGIAAFQVALAAGAPWGRIAYGGGQVQLSDVQRITSGAAAVLWTAAALALLAYAGELAGGRYRDSRALRRVIWLVAALSAFGAVLNLASPSMWERLIWVPVSLGTCALSVLVARSVGSVVMQGVQIRN